MTNDLRPCPFCGGEAHAALAAYASGATAHVVCDGCGAKVYGYSRGERGLRDAVESWNRRAERTCEMLPLAAGAVECSACGAALEGATVGSYCKECGARVVGCDDA